MDKHIIQIHQIKLPLDHELDHVKEQIISILKIDSNIIKDFRIIKKSVDARKKLAIKIVYSVEVELTKPLSKKQINNANILLVKPKQYVFPSNNKEMLKRPVIVGAGPAGLFCGLLLAESGHRPILLERGKKVEERIEDVKTFFEKGTLDEVSNIQFGEGGAGTFSDGKINTGIKDKFQRKQKIIDTFIEAGAPEEIRYQSKPHIGTDYLIKVVKNIREKIRALGGEVLFNHQVTNIIINEHKEVKGVQVNNQTVIETDHVVLAIGHSARDTFKMLSTTEVNMEQKAFAIGVRIEHPQELIAKNQYGDNYKHHHLPVADYKLTYRTNSGRGVYTFCMCPGGFVVNSASEKGHLVCNGMSNYKRDEMNANSAVLVNVTPEDFGSEDLLAGVEFQRKWERLAFLEGGENYHLPIQRFEDFSQNRPSHTLGKIKPNTKGKYTLGNIQNCLPNYVADALIEGIKAFDRKINGFADKDAVLTGVETRSSSPIRILRNETFSSNITGLYPCGEGAGYAGGIMSAAIDGIKVAESIVTNL